AHGGGQLFLVHRQGECEPQVVGALALVEREGTLRRPLYVPHQVEARPHRADLRAYEQLFLFACDALDADDVGDRRVAETAVPVDVISALLVFRDRGRRITDDVEVNLLDGRLR